MKIVEILYETIDPLDKAEALLSLGQINLPNQDPLDRKRLEQLSTNVNATYQKYPQSKQDLKEAALALSLAAADYIEIIDNHPSKNDPIIQELRKKIDSIRQSNLDLYNS